jgi:RimJ/RimL family protein N-acetyltransferase
MMLFQTQRTTLRSFEKSDFTPLFKMMSDDQVMKFTGFGETQTADQVRKLLSRWIKEGQKDLGTWAAVDSKSNEFIGWFMLKKTISDDPEIGFMLPKEKWGKGYATEVSKSLLDYAFETLRLKKVIASTKPENLASINVLKKLGMLVSVDIFQKDLCYFEKENHRF